MSVNKKKVEWNVEGKNSAMIFNANYQTNFIVSA